MKDRRLRACRHPAAFPIAHYRRCSSAAFGLGWRHGPFCAGCCWALMLVAFAAGMTDLRLMAGVTALMACEKVGRHEMRPSPARRGWCEHSLGLTRRGRRYYIGPAIGWVVALAAVFAPLAVVRFRHG